MGYKNLTSTEEEILQDTMTGLSNKQIAYKRYRSMHTITTHMKHIKEKLAAKNTPEAITKYLKSHPNPKELLKTLLFVVLQFNIIFFAPDMDLRRVTRARRGRKNKTELVC